MTQAAAPECECLDGYFRNNENRVTDPDAQSFLSAPNEQPNATCTSEYNILVIVRATSLIRTPH